MDTEMAVGRQNSRLARAGRQTDPFTTPEPPAMPLPTSIAAAFKIRSKTALLRQRILEFVATWGNRGATDREIQAFFNMSGDTERPRRWELVKMGRLYDSGEVRHGMSVWRAR